MATRARRQRWAASSGWRRRCARRRAAQSWRAGPSPSRASGVGFLLARHVSEAGGRLVVADVNAERVARAVDQLGAEPVAPEHVFGVDCDVLAPCALGGVLNDDTIPRLRCAVVAGAANNQLLDERRHAEMLRDRGILYAPDYVINAGGIINVGWSCAPAATTPGARSGGSARSRRRSPRCSRGRGRGASPPTRPRRSSPKAALAAGRQRPGSHQAAGERAARHGVVLGPRHQEDGSGLRPGQRTDEELQPDRERERLVRLLSAEGDERLGRCLAGEHLTVRHRAHGDVRDHRQAVARRNRDRERVGAGERRSRPPGEGRRGEVAVSAATSPPSASRRTQ